MRASPHGSHSACTDMLVRAVCCERTYTCPFFGSTHGSHSACTGMLVRSNCLALFSFLGGLPEDYFLIAQAQKVTVVWRAHASLTFPRTRAQNLVTDLLPYQIANPKRTRCWGNSPKYPSSPNNAQPNNLDKPTTPKTEPSTSKPRTLNPNNPNHTEQTQFSHP